VVTTVDAVNGVSSLDRFSECIKQAAIADRIILTKIDLVEGVERDAKITELRDRLRKLNPAAPIIETTRSNVDPSDLFGTGLFDPDTKAVDFAAWLKADAYDVEQPAGEDAETKSPSEPDAEALSYYQSQGHAAPTAHAHDADIKSFVLVRDKPLTLDMLRLFLEGLTREAGPDLLRVKGIVHVEERPDRPAVIQGAQQIFHSLDWLADWPSEDRRTRIVFITRAIDQDYIEDIFDLIERVAVRTVKAAEAARSPEFPA
jgi:G3E family GTPase